MPQGCVPLRRRWRALLLLALIAGPGACRLPETKLIAPPARHSVRAEELLVQSDFKLSKDHPLIADLVALRNRILQELDLPTPREQVVVYLFQNEAEYLEYLDATYPGLPRRRAYFVGTPRELAVYTYWGERLQEDLRHEYTHGILHACLKSVPLWLDEGLAEYFEVASSEPAPLNREHTGELAVALSNGWRPDMRRLEHIEKFEQMQRTDYQESWAWVHFMLHGSPESRDTLLSYLRDLRSVSSPSPLSRRLEDAHSQIDDRFLAYLATFETQRLMGTALR
ncbi:MAG TPA: DUF1570 domain-containing protein [Planctomycetaceae bacterium]|nr:DUF1570 domain-containing protein [Planctomycetaceae bacterium]